MAKIKIADADINYEVVGEGIELVMLTGMTGSIDNYWVGLLPGLKQKCKVIALDNRGMGKTLSREQNLSIELMAEDAIGLIRELNLSKPNICGHSMGGAIAMTLAKNYPDEIGNIIIANSFPVLSNRARLVFQSMVTQLHHGLSSIEVYWSVLPWLYSENFLSNERKVANLRQFVESRIFNIEGFCKQVDALLQFDARNWLPQIRNDTLIIGSKDDVITPPEQSEFLSESIIDSRLAILEGGHLSHIEESNELVKLILDFLE